MGLDPGLRTKGKVAVADSTGKLIGQIPFILIPTRDKAAASVAALCAIKHNVELVAIGNGTASRETERFFADTARKRYQKLKHKPMIVSEVGHPVYSASELAAERILGSDVSWRCFYRSSLYKIHWRNWCTDPKSIGVGHQHDVSQILLAKKLDNCC